jgi:hypothetical protein
VPWDLDSLLLRKGLGAVASSRELCRRCGRTPLPGERMYVLGSARSVCALCRPHPSEEMREDAQGHLVHARERPLPIRSRPF